MPGTSVVPLPVRLAANEAPVLLLRSQAALTSGQDVVPAHPMKTEPKTAPLTAIDVPARKAASSTSALALHDRQCAPVRSAMETMSNPKLPSAMDSDKGIVFVLDISGSMYEPYDDTTRLTLARQILGEEIRHLPEGTPFAVVVYGETARRSGVLVGATDATRSEALDFLGQEFDCGGGTNLPNGLALARELGTGAVVLITDGDLNMKASELLPKSRQILASTGTRPALTVIAIAPRPHTGDEALLRKLANQQGGIYESDTDVILTASSALAAQTARVAAR